MDAKHGHVVKRLVLSAVHGKHYYFIHEDTETHRDK